MWTSTYTNPQAYQDRTGLLFTATRANSAIGGVVWKVVDGQPVTLLRLGPAQSFSNGELQIWANGRLYYITSPCDGGKPPCPAPRELIAYEIPGWTP
jgi:hypothetical protein